MKTTIEIKEWISKNGTGEKVKYSELHNDSSSDEIVTLVDFDAEEFEKWFNSKEPEYIDIPEGIVFIGFEKDNTLGLVFNSGRQILVIDSDDNVFETLSSKYIHKRGFEKAMCALVECKYEDLVVGDIFIYCSKEEDVKDKKESLDEYTLFLGDDKMIYISEQTDIVTFAITPSSFYHFYKVVKK